MAPTEKKKKQRLIGAVVGVLFLSAVIIVPIAIEVSQDQKKSTINIDNRIECKPFSNLTEQSCRDAGCLWEPIIDTNDTLSASTNNIACFLPDTNVYGYEVNGLVNSFDGGFKVELRRRRVNDVPVPSLYGGDVDEVVFEVSYHTNQALSFAFYAKGSERSKLRPPVSIQMPTGENNKQLYTVKLVKTEVGQPFNFQIQRKSSKVVLFDTSMGGLTIADQFLMISTKLPTKYLYGFGENTHNTFVHDLKYRTWPIFTRDIEPGQEGINLYGAHPFYMVGELDGSAHGVFFLNSHSIDVTTMPSPGLTLRTIGGMLEFFVFLGPEPESVIQQYTEVIGRPFMPPYFGLGFQLSRWGYKNTGEIQNVISRNRAAGIPHDVQYADIDYMDGRRDFTIDRVNFGDLPALVDEIKKDGLRFITIIDPAIADDYASYERGKANGVFVTWANSNNKPENQPTDNDIVFGNVWPENRTAFPDFFKDSTKQWWLNEMLSFYEQLKFDAIWIDMNEVSNFDTNRYSDKLNCRNSTWDDPPYVTMASRTGYQGEPNSFRLSDKTICMETKFGNADDEHLHYEVHNLYGYMQSIATQQAVQSITKTRSMVLSRSTFAGSGKYTAHWLGDNFSSWVQMRQSIIGMLEFNMFGIPFVGADVCGFNGDTTEELCERWMELGAFYPFSRNHNGYDSIDQDPAMWPSTVASSARKALNIRYRLLPYLYTLFYESHTMGSTVVRPLYHEYPKDSKARSIDKQFLWGPALMISPVLEEGKTTVQVYIPDDIWYDYYTGAEVPILGNTTLDAPRDYINLHVRGGYILPAQKPALNTMLSRKNNFELLVALKNSKAKGTLFWDDGESIDTISKEQYQINTFEFANNALTLKANKKAEFPGIGPNLDLIQVMGWSSTPKNITLDGVELDYTYVATTKRLTLHCNISMNAEETVIKFE